MADYLTGSIRNIALMGHGGEGKTTLTEAMLYAAGIVDRQGKVEDGNTTTDFEPEEIRRHCSISAATAPCDWNGKMLNIIDVPGYFDFIGAADSDNKRGAKIDVIEYVFENMKISDRRKVIMLGDRLYDVEGAKLAKIDSGGVLWGFGSRDELVQAGANYVFETPNEVKKFFT